MPEWYENAEGSEGGIQPATEYDVKKVAQNAVANLKRGGTPISEAGQLRDAQSQAAISETIQRMSKIADNGPPMSSELIDKSDIYYRHQDRVMGNTSGGMTKSAYYGGPAFTGLAQGGIPPYTDPLNSPTRWGVPTWNAGMGQAEMEDLLRKSREWCTWYYRNHAIVPTCLNIYAKYPFVGLDIQVPDPTIEDEYKSMFFDLLDYEKRLPEASLQFWKNGEAPMLGEWDPGYGGWVNERIMNSDDISVITWPGPEIEREAFFWNPPNDLISLLEEANPNDPRYLYYEQNFSVEQIESWKEGNPSELPSSVFNLLRHDMDIDGNRGFPLLMRAFGVLMREEKLNQAMTAVADRLYTPFVVAKLGSPNLLQGQYPWIPTDDNLKKMQAHIEMVMASKYRVMVYHSGIEFENVFANQTVPNLNEDFDRATKEIMGVFGISPELIYGGSAGTYASGALSAEIMMQNLSASQKVWSRWWIMDRAKRVAEERGYYVVERKGQTYTKPMELVREWSPEQRRYVNRTRRKLMLPAIRMETMDWRDQETTMRQLMDIRMRLDAPIPNQHFISLIDPNLNMESAREQYAEEKISDYEMKQSLGPAAQQQGPAGGGMGGGSPLRGGGGAPGGPTGAPGGDINGDNPNGPGGGMPGSGDRPPQSDGQRADQPIPMVASIRAKVAKLFGRKTAEEAQKEEPTIVTTSYNKSHEMSRIEKDILDMKISKMDDETKKRFEERAPEREDERPAPTYAEAHMFNHFRTNGEKKGTLYYAENNRLAMGRVK